MKGELIPMKNEADASKIAIAFYNFESWIYG